MLVLVACVPKHSQSVNIFILVTSTLRIQRRVDSDPHWQTTTVLAFDKIILTQVCLFTVKKAVALKENRLMHSI